MIDRLPPPVLGAGQLGEAPDPGQPIGADPILGAYEDTGQPAPEEAPGLPIGPDEVTAFIVAIGDVLARVRGPHWAIEPDETALAAPAIARQLAKPDNAASAWLMEHGDALLIVVGLGVIIVPRAIVEYQVIQYRRRQLELAGQQQEAHGGSEHRAAVGEDEAGAGPGISGAGAPRHAGNGQSRSEGDTATLRALTGRGSA